MPKKTNPRHIQLTEAEYRKKAREYTDHATRFILSAILYILKDKHNASDDDIKTLAVEFDGVMDAIRQGYVKPKDILETVEGAGLDQYDWRIVVK